MLFVALLRGINVGGKNQINMKSLKKTFEKAGMNNVVTYINSGNIIFSHKDISKNELSYLLEEAIYDDFELQIKVVVLTRDEITEIVSTIPASWKNDKDMRSDILFLRDEINDESVLEKLVIKPAIDTVKYVPCAILWSVDKENITKSGKSKIIGSEIYKKITVRNVNTVRKIYELMQD